MPFVIETTAYVNKEATGWYSKAVLSDNLKGEVTMIPNVTNGQNLAQLNVGNVLQPWSCSFSASGSANLTEKSAVVKAMKINLEECKDVLWTSYLANQLKTMGDTYTPELEQFLFAELQRKVSTQLDGFVINGSVAGGDPFDGWLVQFLADGTVIDVVATTITAANVIAEIGKVYDAIPLAILDEVTLFVSPAIATAYQRALVAFNPALMAYNGSDITLKYLNVPMQVDKHLPANRMFACRKDNLITMTQMESDIDKIELIDLEKTTGDAKVRFVGAFKYGVSFFEGSEIVYYN